MDYMKYIPDPKDVEAVFAAFDPKLRTELELCRGHILSMAAEVEGVGAITETLKWGQPSYLTEESGSGSTIRLGGTAEAPALYVHCATNLIEQFRTHYPDTFDYEGKRALVIRDDVQSVAAELRHCIALALTYKLRRETRRRAAT